MTKKKKNINQHTTTSTNINQPKPTSTKNKKNKRKEQEEIFTKEKIKLIKQEWLSGERPKIAQLKTGIHDNIFYYGTTLYDIYDKPKCAIVTSDKKIYVSSKQTGDEIREEFGLKYRYDFEYEVLDSHVSVQTINEFIKGEFEADSLKELFEELVRINKEYMWYPDDIAHEYVSLDILSTYWLPCFQAKGRTLLEADKGSGKTRQSQIYSLLSFNAMMSDDITKSSFFRIMESTVGTLIIDDFDNDINDEQKRDVLQHYKTGYKNSSKSIRTGEATKGKRRIEAFRNYGHVILNNTVGLDPISRERSIPLPIIRYDGEITDKPVDLESPEWFFRDSLYIAGLTYWKEVKEAYDSCYSEKLKARRFEISRPILALASLIDKRLFDRVEDWLDTRLNESNYVDVETDWEYLIVKQFIGCSDEQKYSLTELAEQLLVSENVVSTDGDYQRRKLGICKYIGKHFRNLPGVFKIVTITGKNHLKLLSQARLEEWLRSKGWWRLVEVSGGETLTKPFFEKTEKLDVGLSFVEPLNHDRVLKMIDAYRRENKKNIPVEELSKYFVSGFDDWFERQKSDGVLFEEPIGFVRLV